MYASSSEEPNKIKKKHDHTDWHGCQRHHYFSQYSDFSLEKWNFPDRVNTAEPPLSDHPTYEALVVPYESVDHIGSKFCLNSIS